MREFVVRFSVELLIDQRLLDSVLTDEWRKQMFSFHKPEQVAEHIAFNLVQGTRLTSIDGYADQEPKRVLMGPIDIDDSYEVQPSKPTPRARPRKVANDEDAHGANPIRVHPEEPKDRKRKKR